MFGTICFFVVNLTLQDPVLYISFPLLWSLLDFFAANSHGEAVLNDAGTVQCVVTHATTIL